MYIATRVVILLTVTMVTQGQLDAVPMFDLKNLKHEYQQRKPMEVDLNPTDDLNFEKDLMSDEDRPSKLPTLDQVRSVYVSQKEKVLSEVKKENSNLKAPIALEDCNIDTFSPSRDEIRTDVASQSRDEIRTNVASQSRDEIRTDVASQLRDETFAEKAEEKTERRRRCATTINPVLEYLDPKKRLQEQWKCCCPRSVNYQCTQNRYRLPCFPHYEGNARVWCFSLWPVYVTRCTCNQCGVLTETCVRGGQCQRRYSRRSFLAVCWNNNYWGGNWYLSFVEKYLPSSCYCNIPAGTCPEF